MGTRAFLRLLRPKSWVLRASLVPVLLFALFLIPMTVTAQVTVYAEANCPESGLKRTYSHVSWPDLSTQYYEGSSVSLNNTISSIRIEGGWEVLGCGSFGFNTCAAQLNTEKQVYSDGTPKYQDRCLNMTSSSWSSTNPIPVNNAISSLLVQPKDFDTYWQYYTYQEDSSQPSGRYGYVELFTGTDYTGIGLKIYYSHYDLSNSAVHSGVHSIKVHGNLVSRLCNDQGQDCANNVLINKDTPNIQSAPIGVQTLIPPHSAAMVMKSSDMPKQANNFARAFLNHGPTYRRNSFFQWAQSGEGTTHVMTWPSGDCYEACNDNDALCRDNADCKKACQKNMCAYMERVNRAGYRWAGDSSLVFLSAHGLFAVGNNPYAGLEMIHTESCNHQLAQFHSRDDQPPAPACPYPWTQVDDADGDGEDDVDGGHRWGNFNTDWVITTACESLGRPPLPRPPTDGASLQSSTISKAWKSLLLSGVHGIGGFYEDSHWRSLPWDNSGDELADDFWTDLVTKSFAQAWGETSERFLGASDRVVYYMVACPTNFTVAQCVARMNNDYYHGYQTGPKPDLVNHSDLRFHVEEYEP